jgi:carboxylate-amine ligase
MTIHIARPNVRRGSLKSASFRFGIEEEYFLADSNSFEPPAETPDRLFDQLRECGIALERELLQSQLEVGTRPHTVTRDACLELQGLRIAASFACRRHGLEILACGTHPMGRWRKAVASPKPRYEQLMEDLQIVGRRNMLCGMHVHVEFPDAARRVDVMTRMIPYVPLLLALSTSSPFWQGHPTGLKGYRLTAYDELPRTGLPELFASTADYQQYIQAMQRSGAIADATHVWWAIRPSVKYPTLELRAPDCCTRIEDAVAIASLYRALVRCLYRRRDLNADISVVERALALENKWRAQRYGTAASFVTRDGAVPLAEILRTTLSLVEEDAEALDCQDRLDPCLRILVEGSSADAQLRMFEQHPAGQEKEALCAVAKWIAQVTLA